MMSVVEDNNMAKHKECKGCGVRSEVVAMFGGLDAKGFCKGCGLIKVAEIKVAGRVVAVKDVSKSGGEWSPEIAEAMRIPH